MIVINLVNCPPSLRGDLSKWLQEINTGVYVGQVSSRVRDEIWGRVCDKIKSGSATLVYNTNNEQRMDFRVHNTTWEPIDFDGLKLILRPGVQRKRQIDKLRTGFSKASTARNAKKFKGHQNSRLPPPVYTVVDIETTGLSIKEHDIIEIGAILIEKGIIIKEFHSFIQIKSELPQSIKILTGITEASLNDEGEHLHTAMKNFLGFVGDLPIVSHNAKFDYSFLCKACEHCSLPILKNRSIDTLSLSRKLVDDVNNYKLLTLLDYFGISSKGAHRSIADCYSTKQLYDKLNEIRLVKNKTG